MMSALPETIGRFEITSFIGRGGMAAVYHAYDPEQDRPVAIKVLGQEYQNDLGFRARFEREAETIARLSHPAIVRLCEFGQQAGPNVSSASPSWLPWFWEVSWLGLRG